MAAPSAPTPNAPFTIPAIPVASQLQPSSQPSPSTPVRNRYASLVPQTPTHELPQRDRLPATEPEWPPLDTTNVRPYYEPNILNNDRFFQWRTKAITAFVRGGRIALFKIIVACDKFYNPSKSPLLPQRNAQSNPSAMIEEKCYAMLAYWQDVLIKGFILGDSLSRFRLPSKLSRKRPKGDPTRDHPRIPIAEYEPFTRFPENHPAIYVHNVVDSNGRRPTVIQVIQFLLLLTMYCEDWEDFQRGRNPTPSQDVTNLAVTVDNVMPSATIADPTDLLRPYNITEVPLGARKYIKSFQTLQRIRGFIAHTQRFIDQIPVHQRHREMPLVWSETGWTGVPYSRLTLQHDKHRNSVPLMNLIDAIGFLRVGTVGWPQFRTRSYIVLEPWDEQSVPLAEHMVSVLTSSYDYLGGFNSSIAGLSYQKAYNDKGFRGFVWNYWAQKVDLTAAKATLDAQKTQFHDQVIRQAKMVLEHDARVARASIAYKQVQDQDEQFDQLEEKIRDLIKTTDERLTQWADLLQRKLKQYENILGCAEVLDQTIRALNVFNSEAARGKTDFEDNLQPDLLADTGDSVFSSADPLDPKFAEWEWWDMDLGNLDA